MTAMNALRTEPAPSLEPSPPGAAVVDFVRVYSVETTPAESARRASYREDLPAGTRVHITAIAGKPFADTVATARRLRAEGLVPVPHITARSVAAKP